MKLIPFIPGHLNDIKPRDIDTVNLKDFKRNILNQISKNPFSKCFTITNNGEVMACGGIVALWEGVGEVWLIGSASINKKMISFHKLCLKGLRNIIDTGKWHRVQSVVRADFPEGIGWNRLLGFKVEALMKGYAPDGVDCFLYRLGGV